MNGNSSGHTVPPRARKKFRFEAYAGGLRLRNSFRIDNNQIKNGMPVKDARNILC